VATLRRKGSKRGSASRPEVALLEKGRTGKAGRQLEEERSDVRPKASVHGPPKNGDTLLAEKKAKNRCKTGEE